MTTVTVNEDQYPPRLKRMRNRVSRIIHAAMGKDDLALNLLVAVAKRSGRAEFYANEVTKAISASEIKIVEEFLEEQEKWVLAEIRRNAH